MVHDINNPSVKFVNHQRRIFLEQWMTSWSVHEICLEQFFKLQLKNLNSSKKFKNNLGIFQE
jgi:hypothetical protein